MCPDTGCYFKMSASWVASSGLGSQPVALMKGNPLNSAYWNDVIICGILKCEGVVDICQEYIGKGRHLKRNEHLINAQNWSTGDDTFLLFCCTPVVFRWSSVFSTMMIFFRIHKLFTIARNRDILWLETWQAYSKIAEIFVSSPDNHVCKFLYST